MVGKNKVKSKEEERVWKKVLEWEENLLIKAEKKKKIFINSVAQVILTFNPNSIIVKKKRVGYLQINKLMFEFSSLNVHIFNV